MNSRIANTFRAQAYNCRYLSVHCTSKQLSLNKNKQDVNNNHYQNRYNLSSLGLTRSTLKNHVLCAAAPARYNFQNRYMSSDTNFQQNTDQITDLTPAETAVEIPSDTWPELIKNFSESQIVEAARQVLLKVHETTGLPWWASIALTAYMMRTAITLPFSILQSQNSAKLELIKPEMEQIVKNCKLEAKRAVNYHGLPESVAKRKLRMDVKKEYNKLIVEYNCHPFKSYVLLLIQLPIWFSFSFATRNLSYMIPRGDPATKITYMEMTLGGFGWAQNLTEADPYLILPLICTLMNLTIIEVYAMFQDQTNITRFQKIQRIFARCLSLFMFPIAMYLPTGTVIYWISSSSFGLVQAFLFQSTRFKRLIGVPNLEGQLDQPYRLFYNNLKSRLHLTSK